MDDNSILSYGQENLCFLFNRDHIRLIKNFIWFQFIDVWFLR